jgi:hypothetical protein
VSDPVYYVGLDLGQVSDHTALAVLERLLDDGAPRTEATYGLRHLERMALGTSYPAIVRDVGDLMTRLPQGATLVADATGVGRAVIDLLRAAKLRPVPVVVHAGQQTTVDDRGYKRVPKRELVGTTQVALQQGRLKFAAVLPLVGTLKEELQNFKIKITEAGNDTYEAWREGQHDDLVFALCLACWHSERFLSAQEWARLHPPRPYSFALNGKAGRAATRDREEAMRRYRGPGVDPFAGAKAPASDRRRWAR